MWNLIMKDIVTTKKNFIFIFALYLIFSMFPGIPANPFFIVGIYIYTMQIAYLEEKNNTLSMLRSMPIKSSVIVWSKFLSVLLMASALMIIGFFANFYVNQISFTENMQFLLGTFLMLWMMGVFLLFYFRFGYQQASKYGLVLYLVVFVFVILPLFGGDINLLSFLEAMTILNQIVLLIGLLLAYFILILIAVPLFTKRDL